MPLSLSEQLTAQFYEWEQRGRGWLVFDSPVDPEPPYVPFFFHAVPSVYVDDGKRATIFSSIAELLKPPSRQVEVEVAETDKEIEPYIFEDESPLHALRVALPKGEKIKVLEMEQLLLMLSYCSAPVSFEIIATHTQIRIQFVCRESDTLHIHSQLKAYFPNCVVTDARAEVFDIIPDGKKVHAVDYGLKEEFMRPLSVAESFDLDPYTGLFGFLDSLDEGEQAALQVIFKGAVNSWSESIMRSVTDGQGDAFFLDAPEMVDLAKEKVSSPLFGVSVRVIG